MLIWTVCGEEIFGAAEQCFPTAQCLSDTQSKNTEVQNLTQTLGEARTELRLELCRAQRFTECRAEETAVSILKKIGTEQKKNVLSALDILKMM